MEEKKNNKGCYLILGCFAWMIIMLCVSFATDNSVFPIILGVLPLGIVLGIAQIRASKSNDPKDKEIINQQIKNRKIKRGATYLAAGMFLANELKRKDSWFNEKHEWTPEPDDPDIGDWIREDNNEW